MKTRTRIRFVRTAAIAMILVMLLCTNVAFAKSTSIKFKANPEGADYCEVVFTGSEDSLRLDKQGGHFTSKDGGEFISKDLSGINVYDKSGNLLHSYNRNDLDIKPEGNGGSGSVNIFLANPGSSATPTPGTTPTPTPTPSATPEVTPSTSPEVTPSTSPEVTPSTSPEVTPSTSPEVTPSTSPEVTPSTSPEVTPSTSPEVTPSTSPEVVIPDEDTPLADPDEVTIEDEDVPLASPVTGDNQGSMLLMLLAGAALAMGILLSRLEAKKGKNF